MTPEIVGSIIDKFGGQTKLAMALGCDQSTIAHWKRRGVIPARQQGRVLEAASALGIQLEPADFFRTSTPSEVA